jgi:hypothetical protein
VINASTLNQFNMLTVRGYGEGYGTYCHFQQYFSYIVAVGLIGGVPGENH